MRFVAYNSVTTRFFRGHLCLQAYAKLFREQGLGWCWPCACAVCRVRVPRASVCVVWARAACRACHAPWCVRGAPVCAHTAAVHSRPRVRGCLRAHARHAESEAHAPSPRARARGSYRAVSGRGRRRRLPAARRTPPSAGWVNGVKWAAGSRPTGRMPVVAATGRVQAAGAGAGAAAHAPGRGQPPLQYAQECPPRPRRLAGLQRCAAQRGHQFSPCRARAPPPPPRRHASVTGGPKPLASRLKAVDSKLNEQFAEGVLSSSSPSVLLNMLGA